MTTALRLPSPRRRHGSRPCPAAARAAVLGAALGVACLPAAAAEPAGGADAVEPPRDPGYRLVWSDEFDRDGAPDPAAWRFEQGFVRNHELQWYQPDNARCEDGLLVIEARREKVANPEHREGSPNWRRSRAEAGYTSASLTTAGKVDWTYGRFEIRARFPALPGLWPAIWTTGRGRWPHGGEIDIMEYYDHGILANYCWAGPRGRSKWDSSFHKLEKFDPTDGEKWGEEFHLWVMEWEPEEIRIFLDGVLLNTLDMDRAVNEDGPAINPFTRPQAMRLNMAIGGDRGGDPSKTAFPQRYEIDYVRVYQKEAPGGADKPPSEATRDAP